MLRPIDMTLTIQHAADAHRAGTSDSGAARPEVASQMFADRLEKQARLQQQQVQNTNQSEHNALDPEREGRGGAYQQNRKRKSKKPEKGKFVGDKENIRESMFDMRI